MEERGGDRSGDFGADTILNCAEVSYFCVDDPKVFSRLLPSYIKIVLSFFALICAAVLSFLWSCMQRQGIVFSQHEAFFHVHRRVGKSKRPEAIRCGRRR